MDQTGLIYVIGFGIAATIFVFATILAAWVLSHRRRSPQKGLPYECGIDTIGDTWSRFGLAFYLFALLFVAALGILSSLLVRMKIFQAIKLGETT